MLADELMHCLGMLRAEPRTQILGQDEKVSNSGFIDNQNGCVVTSQKAMELAQIKIDRKKKERLDAEKAEPELKEVKRASTQLAETTKFNHVRVPVMFSSVENHWANTAARFTQWMRVTAKARKLFWIDVLGSDVCCWLGQMLVKSHKDSNFIRKIQRCFLIEDYEC